MNWYQEMETGRITDKPVGEFESLKFMDNVSFEHLKSDRTYEKRVYKKRERVNAKVNYWKQKHNEIYK